MVIIDDFRMCLQYWRVDQLQKQQTQKQNCGYFLPQKITGTVLSQVSDSNTPKRNKLSIIFLNQLFQTGTPENEGCDPAKHLLLFLDRMCPMAVPCDSPTCRERLLEFPRWLLSMIAKVQGLVLVTHKCGKT